MVKYSGKVSLRTGQTSGRVMIALLVKGGIKAPAKANLFMVQKAK